MSSNNLSIDDCGSLDISSEILSNKETQTSSTYITDSFDLVKGPSRPLPKGFNKANDVDLPSNNILECKIIKDPTNETTSNDLTSENFIEDIISQNISLEEVNTSPKPLKYCSEVIEPYLQAHLNNHEDNEESLQQVIEDALQDLSDYQPFEVYEGEKDIEERVNTQDNSEMGTTNNLTSQEKETENIHLTSKSVPETNNINIIKEVAPSTDHSVDKDTNSQTKTEEPNKSKSIESITEFVKNSLTTIKRTASSCFNKIEITIGIKKPENPDDKPTYYLMEKPKVGVSPSQNVQTETGDSLNSLKNMINTEKLATFTDACKNFAEDLINNPNEKISAIKESCRNFAENIINNSDEKINTIKETCKECADTIYKTSKDAVDLLSSESAKFLNTNQELNDDPSHDNKNERKLKNISAESVTRFFFHKAENKPVDDDDPDTSAITGSSKLSDAIPPVIKENLCKIRDGVVSSKFEKSSPYDKYIPYPQEVTEKAPEQPEPRIPTVSAIDHTPDPPTSNMFAIIRSKIFSIFRDDTDNAENALLQENENDDEEEDPFEKYMEQ